LLVSLGVLVPVRLFDSRRLIVSGGCSIRGGDGASPLATRFGLAARFPTSPREYRNLRNLRHLRISPLRVIRTTTPRELDRARRRGVV
jgi:hypothetical protein